MGSHGRPPPPPEPPRVGGSGVAGLRHHHPGTCHRCLSSPPDPVRQPLVPPLMRCSQCQLVVYCSRECQRKDWSSHKGLCRVNKVVDGKNVFSKAKEATLSGQSWNEFRRNLRLAAALNLNRRLRLYEEEIFNFPRVCFTCKESDSDKLASCPRCFSVFYCCSSERDADAECHSHVCNEFLLMLECDRLELVEGIQDLPVPVDVDKTYRNLPQSLMSLVGPQLENASSIPLDPKIVTMIAEKLSYPLSLLYAIENVGIGADNRAIHELSELRVHVVGAQAMTELLGIIRWEYLVHRLPALKMFDITFIGPELFNAEQLTDESVEENYLKDDSGLTMCGDCSSGGRRIVYDMANMTYDEFVSNQHYKKPDIIIAYNCGLHENANIESHHKWRPSIPLLITDPSIPFVFTSYTEDEARFDLGILKEICSLSVVLEPHPNPFRSRRPYRDLECDRKPLYFWNQFICCVRAK